MAAHNEILSELRSRSRLVRALGLLGGVHHWPLADFYEVFIIVAATLSMAPLPFTLVS